MNYKKEAQEVINFVLRNSGDSIMYKDLSVKISELAIVSVLNRLSKFVEEPGINKEDISQFITDLILSNYNLNK